MAEENVKEGESSIVEEFAELRTQQQEQYKNISKTDEGKDKKIEDRSNNITEKIMQIEMRKVMTDEDEMSGMSKQRLQAYESEMGRKLEAKLGNSQDAEGPGLVYANLRSKLDDWISKEAGTTTNSSRELKKGMENYYKLMRMKPKSKNNKLDAAGLRALQNNAEGKKEPEQIASNTVEAKSGITIIKHPKKKIIYTDTELIQELYGMERIREYVPAKEIRGGKRFESSLMKQLKEEFAEMGDPHYLEALESVDLSDQICASYPVSTGTSKAGLNITERTEMFYYFHLSPLARKSLSHIGVDNYEEIMEVFLNYLPQSYSSPGGVSKDSYFFAISGLLPLKDFFAMKTQKVIEMQRASLIEERDEFNERDSSISGAVSEVGEASEEPSASVSKASSVVSKEPPPKEIEDLGSDQDEEAKVDMRSRKDELNTSEENEIAQEANYLDDVLNKERSMKPHKQHQLVRQREEPVLKAVPTFSPSFSIDVGQLDLPPSAIEKKERSVRMPEEVPEEVPEKVAEEVAEEVPEIEFGSKPSVREEKVAADPPSAPAERVRYEDRPNTTAESIEKILKETEGLLLMYSVQASPKKGQNAQKEISQRIYENMEKVIEFLNENNAEHKASEEVLVRIAEIGKKYLEGPVQAKLLRAVLEEYRKVQEYKIHQLEEEKQSMETSQQLSERYSVIQALLSVFPEELLKELEELKKAGAGKSSVGTAEGTAAGTVAESLAEISPDILTAEASHKHSLESSMRFKKASPRGRQPKETPRQKLAQAHAPKFKNAAWDVRHVTPKAGDAKAKKGGKKKVGASKKTKQNVKPVKHSEEDSWIGVKSDELEDDTLWKKGDI